MVPEYGPFREEYILERTANHPSVATLALTQQ